MEVVVEAVRSELPTGQRNSLIILKNETKMVLEAFLARTLTLNEGSKVGHVGRYYLDSKKFSSRPEETQGHIEERSSRREGEGKREGKHRGSLEREKEEKRKSPPRGEGDEGQEDWDSTDEDIARAEEKKHNFKTTIRRLIRRKRKAKEDRVEDKQRYKEPLEDRGSVKRQGKADLRSDSLRRQRNTHPLLACAGASGDLSEPEETDVTQLRSSSKKRSGFNLSRLLRKVSLGKLEETPARGKAEQDPDPQQPPRRPNTLPLYGTNQGNNHHNLGTAGTQRSDDEEFYYKVARELDILVQKHHARSAQVSPSTDLTPFESPMNNNVPQPPLSDKEDMIERIVELLQEQGDIINKKMSRDPFLRNKMSRMSYGSFTRLVEVFTADVGGGVGAQSGESVATSPELTKIALTMELTRKVAGINSHAVQQLMGYSMQYMDMFVPWLQANGGWEKAVPLDSPPEHQID
uniref:Bcl-2-like protein 12 n=1 Tax=Callorhinchus milii TaxID=7868 RepID=A0A4W3ISR9_CALMI|eukprot:gi/632982448/ref/XP_007908142.1/ PREDICTED: bcl-2-like protein 12 [Callorhinchus milii]